MSSAKLFYLELLEQLGILAGAMAHAQLPIFANAGTSDVAIWRFCGFYLARI